MRHKQSPHKTNANSFLDPQGGGDSGIPASRAWVWDAWRAPSSLRAAHTPSPWKGSCTCRTPRSGGAAPGLADGKDISQPDCDSRCCHPGSHTRESRQTRVCVLMAPHVETQHHKFKMHPGRENLQTPQEPFFTQHQGYKILFTPTLASSPKSHSPLARLQG